MSTETTKKKIKIDNGTNFARAYTDKAIDAKLPTDLKATATNLSLLAGDTKIGSGINLSGFEYDEATKTLKAKGGSSPCLNLVDFSGNTPVVRTSITEEEKNNIDNRLYSQVIYIDQSLGQNSINSIYFPEIFSLSVDNIFSIYRVLANESSGIHSIVGLSTYAMDIGEKSADGTYPITIDTVLDTTFGGGGSSFEEATLSQLSGFKGQYKALHITDCNVVFNFQEIGEITSNSVYFVGFVNSETQLEGTVWTIVGDNPICLCTGTFYITNGVINGGHCTIGSLNSVSVGSLFTLGGTRSFNSKDATNAIGLYGVQGCEYAGKVDVVSNGATAKKSALTIISNVNKEATGESAFCEMDGLFEGYGLGHMVLKKDANNIPQFKSFTTWLPPVTANSDGKALIVTDGNAQWTTTPRYEHTITIKNSAGKILWTQTMRNSSNTIVNSYANLKTLFGEATYAGFGEYCQLDLRGGTEATDKLIKADGTEATLESLGAIVYTDVCFLPK